MIGHDTVGPMVVDAARIRGASIALLAYADRLDADASRIEAAARALPGGASLRPRHGMVALPGAGSLIGSSALLRQLADDVRALADDAARSATRYEETELALAAQARSAATRRAIRIGGSPAGSEVIGGLLERTMARVWNEPFLLGAAAPLPVGLLASAVAHLLDGRREVVVRRTEARAVAVPPTGLEDLVAGVPRGGPDDGQIRVDRFGDRSVVYIAGTLNTGLPSDEPFDMSSNVIGARGGRADAELAVRAAMADAGVPPGSQVTFVGHSQGGIVAANLARSGDYRVPLLVTVGSPIGSAGFTAADGTAPVAYALAYDEDPIPRLDGVAAAPAGVRLVTASTGAPLGSLPADPLAAHGLDGYTRLAREADTSGDVGMLPLAGALIPVATGAGRSIVYDASRRSVDVRPRSAPGGLGTTTSPVRAR